MAQPWTSRLSVDVSHATRKTARVLRKRTDSRTAQLTRRGCVGQDERVALLGKGSHGVCMCLRRRRDAVKVDKNRGGGGGEGGTIDKERERDGTKRKVFSRND
jgi:hypothetical protein